MNDELSTVLANLASKLGTTTERLWPQLVAAERLEWYTCAVAAVVFTVLAIYLLRESFRNKDVDLGFCLFWAGAVPCVIAVLCTIRCIIGIESIIYPEAAAFRSLLGQLK